MQLAQTCRAAYNVATPRFLSEIVLDGGSQQKIRGSQQISRFCSYIYKNTSYRLPLIRRLTIGPSTFTYFANSGQREPDYSPAGFLADMLIGVANLAMLYIANAEKLLWKSCDMSNAVIALPALSDIELRVAGAHTLAVLTRMDENMSKCPLIGITIAFNGRSDEARKLVDAAKTMAACIPTLRYIGLNLHLPPRRRPRWDDITYTWYRVTCRLTGECPAVDILEDWEAELVLSDLTNLPSTKYLRL
ncbi:hypothetical protein WOLCODRAFT_165370 [Wolfiporia cocos MD-104 SS10]|uniref:Uncharacterized protein n=1 Tax=Wolfiporia cocos (strain MD-104) TaxID=742152 RepID=A0A2H3K6Q0_WOLCO|nr:hypothetical protein WOLCODRAFT_165370 [Wolfiporia cocos MD-104 SS10]